MNQLKEHVEVNHLDRRSVCWKEIDEVTDFPYLDEEGLRALTCGTYQLRLSSSYAQEHMEGDCIIQMHKEEHGLLRIRMRSRHVSSKSYQLWIKYGDGTIIAWYCKCRAGARVVGMCAHTASIVWHDIGVEMVRWVFVTGGSIWMMPPQLMNRTVKAIAQVMRASRKSKFLK